MGKCLKGSNTRAESNNMTYMISNSHAIYYRTLTPNCTAELQTSPPPAPAFTPRMHLTVTAMKAAVESHKGNRCKGKKKTYLTIEDITMVKRMLDVPIITCALEKTFSNFPSEKKNMPTYQRRNWSMLFLLSSLVLLIPHRSDSIDEFKAREDVHGGKDTALRSQ
ncbi:hypothetical protein C8J56DRAFT_891482 [Mycena floridula]|nr:hypothetical protein C8J56DRAFT_891482 [Mycena floridula]